MPLRAGAARRGRTESVTGVWLQRDDGGGDGELRSGLSPGGRVRLFVVTTRKKTPRQIRVLCHRAQLGQHNDCSG